MEGQRDGRTEGWKNRGMKGRRDGELRDEGLGSKWMKGGKDGVRGMLGEKNGGRGEIEKEGTRGNTAFRMHTNEVLGVA